MMPLWEHLRTSSMTPEVEYRYDAPTIAVDPETDEETLVFPDPHSVLRRKPMRVASFEAKGYTDAEAQALFDQVESGALAYELTDHLGVAWSGEIGSLSEKPVANGGASYFVLTLTLNKAVKNAS